MSGQGASPDVHFTSLEVLRRIAHGPDLHPAFRDLLHSFVEASVEFVVVGGFAVAVHGEPRFTADMDVFVRPSPDNAKRTRIALRHLGFGDVGWAEDEFERPDCTVMLGRKPLPIDLLTGISGVSFDEAWRGRVTVEVDGVSVPFIGRERLIVHERASGRHKDLADLEALGEI